MAFTVADSRTLLTACDDVGDWSESTTSYYVGSEEGGREGTGFVGFDLDIETIHSFEQTVTTPSDVSGGIHLGAWIRVLNGGDLDTKANGGIRLCMQDTSGNESYFYVGGSDTYTGGWYYFVADMSGTPDANNGTNASTTAVNYFGVGGKCFAKTLTDNFQIDRMVYGTSGLTVTGTPDTSTYGTGKSFQEIYDLIDTNNYGLMSKQAGSFVIKGPLTLNTTTFNDIDSIAFFEDMPVGSSFYKISLGTTSGNDVDFAGFIMKTEGDTAAELDLSAAVTSLNYDGSTFLTSGTATFKSGTYTGNKVVDCTAVVANAGADLEEFIINESGQITLNTTATLTDSIVYKSSSAVSVSLASIERASGNTFTSDGSNHAVDRGTVSANVTENWNNTLSGYAATNGSTGNEAIKVNVASGITYTIEVTGGTTPKYYNTGTGTVVVNEGSATLTLTGVETNTEVRLYNSALTEEIYGIENSSGNVAMSYTGTYVDAVLVIHHLNYGYIRLVVQLDGVSSSLPIDQQDDDTYQNPA